MARPELCASCKRGGVCIAERFCSDIEDAYDIGHAEGHAAGVTDERELWRAVVKRACDNACDALKPGDLLELYRYGRANGVALTTAERVLLEILEAMEPKT